MLSDGQSGQFSGVMPSFLLALSRAALGPPARRPARAPAGPAPAVPAQSNPACVASPSHRHRHTHSPPAPQAYVHASQVDHRVLRLEDVLLAQPLADDQPAAVKISDVGFSASLREADGSSGGAGGAQPDHPPEVLASAGRRHQAHDSASKARGPWHGALGLLLLPPMLRPAVRSQACAADTVSPAAAHPTSDGCLGDGRAALRSPHGPVALRRAAPD